MVYSSFIHTVSDCRSAAAMEFQEAVTKVKRPIGGRSGGSVKFPWKFSFRRPSKLSSSSLSQSSSSSPARHSTSSEPQKGHGDFPAEYICPVSGSLMADPVIVPSGHSFDRVSVEVCRSTGYVPTLDDGTTPDFTAVIPNISLKSAILTHCMGRSLPPPEPLSFSIVEKIVRGLLAVKIEMCDSSDSMFVNVEEITPADTKADFFPDESCSSSDELAGVAVGSRRSSSATTAAATTKKTPPPSCCSSSGSSSDIRPADPEEEDLITKLESSKLFEIKEAALRLRRITLSREEKRVSLCNDRFLSALRPLIVSAYGSIQVNSVAALVNLSLEKVNKAKIVRSGILPNLIFVLEVGLPEAQEHAAAALSSLAVDDRNRAVIGAHGALLPLVDMLRSTSEQAWNDSAQALYHLSLSQSNCIQLLDIKSVQVFLGVLRSGILVESMLLILSNLGSCPEGRTALLDSGAVDCLLGLLDQQELKSESAQDHCLNALLALSRDISRFKELTKASGASRTLKKVASEGARNTARFLMDIIE